jgi:hypothetical protein
LRDRYVVQRELSRGGMATVYMPVGVLSVAHAASRTAAAHGARREKWEVMGRSGMK